MWTSRFKFPRHNQYARKFTPSYLTPLTRLSPQFYPHPAPSTMFLALVNTVRCWLMSVWLSGPSPPLAPTTAALPLGGARPPKRCKAPVCDPLPGLPVSSPRALVVQWLARLPVPFYAPVHTVTPARRYPARARAYPDRFCSCQSLSRPACLCDMTED